LDEPIEDFLKPVDFGARNKTDEGVEDLAEIATDRDLALEAVEHVTLLVQHTTKTLAAVDLFTKKDGKSDSFVTQRKVAKKEFKQNRAAMKKSALDDEANDIDALLKLLKPLEKPVKEIQTLDNYIKQLQEQLERQPVPSAYEPIEEVMKVIDRLRVGLTKRLSDFQVIQVSKDPRFPELSNELKDVTLNQFSAAIHAATTNLEDYGKEKEELTLAAQQKVRDINQHHRDENVTIFADIKKNAKIASRLWQCAGRSKARVKQVWDLANMFVENYLAYVTAQDNRAIAFKEDVNEAKAQTAESIAEIDEAELDLVAPWLYSYAQMWKHTMAVKDVLKTKASDPGFGSIITKAHEYAIASHLYINDKTQKICQAHQGCKKVRAKLINKQQEKFTFCDERGITTCTEANNGAAPSGRFCEWKGDKLFDEKSQTYYYSDQFGKSCKTIRAPTGPPDIPEPLKYHQQHETRGIFY